MSEPKKDTPRHIACQRVTRSSNFIGSENQAYSLMHGDFPHVKVTLWPAFASNSINAIKGKK
jgi:hypothetical protein